LAALAGRGVEGPDPLALTSKPHVHQSSTCEESNVGSSLCTF